jgi:mRNA interferase MazF
VTCDPWDVVIVPFPFTDGPGTKQRPALVLSKRSFNVHGHTVLAMITSSAHNPWLGDTNLRDHAPAGLRTPCIVRLKLFTLDNRLILKSIGRLSSHDRHCVSGALQKYISLGAPN